jgi:hypothetical protein
MYARGCDISVLTFLLRIKTIIDSNFKQRININAIKKLIILSTHHTFIHIMLGKLLNDKKNINF